MERDPVIEAKNLFKNYRDLTAVSGVSFEVYQGELFGFLGPNGAGKTTIMRMIQCVSPRSSGDLSVFSRDTDRDGRIIRSRIGVVPQEANLDPDLSVEDNILVYARFFRIPPMEAITRTEELLSFFELTRKRKTPIASLSGGMKRRLLLARALINRPSLLILDEPTIGLDPQARHHIWERLMQLKQEGNTIVLTTHYLDEAQRLCDRLVIMDQGQILAEGSPDDLVKRYFQTDIIETDNDPLIRDCLIKNRISFETAGDLIQIKDALTPLVADHLLMQCSGVRIIRRPPTLEDVFLLLTGRRIRE
ncbi:MAG: ABC transporter ATP-binding protein [Methanospirillaceae archaeon]|nr:ABC transporter ATP-binding protein [Methanospirillaceae archaeon]